VADVTAVVMTASFCKQFRLRWPISVVGDGCMLLLTCPQTCLSSPSLATGQRRSRGERSETAVTNLLRANMTLAATKAIILPIEGFHDAANNSSTVLPDINKFSPMRTSSTVPACRFAVLWDSSLVILNSLSMTCLAYVS